MGMRLGELTAIVNIDDSRVAPTLAKDRAQMAAAGKGMAKDFEAAGRDSGAGFHRGATPGFQRFFRDANGRLHNERGRFVREFEQLGQAVAAAAGGGLSGLFGLLGELGGAAGKAGGPLTILAIVIGGLAAVAMFAGPALGAVATALAALPALAFGGAVAIASLVIGLSGISDHFKRTAKAGGSVVDRAYQIIQAERRLRDANNEARASQVALNRAREDAARKMRDLNLEVRRSRLDLASAEFDLADAQKELDAAQASGDPDRIARAQLAYDQAVTSVQELRNRVTDLGAEQARVNKAGVEGSDQVQAALDRQRHAIEGIQDAEHALAQARRSGGGGGAAQQLAKISKNAQAFVDAVKSLKPAWERLRLSVQDKLFAGVGDELKDLAKAWLPLLTSKLGNFASTFNGIFKTFSSTAQKPEFIDKVGSALDAVNRLIERIGTAAAGPFLDAMATLGEAAAPILDMIGQGAADFLSDFADWIKSGEKSGKLQSFLDKASGFLHDVFHMGKTVLGIVGDITAILFQSEDSGHSSWQSFLDFLDKAKAWLDDPANQKKAADWMEKFQLIGQGILRFIAIVVTAGAWLFGLEQKFDNFVTNVAVKIARFVRGAKDKWDDLVAFVKGLPGRIAAAARGMWDGLKEAFKSALNWIIDKWNGLEFKIPSIVPGIGGASLKPPPLHRFASGGIAKARPGGTLAQLAEAGQDEAVMPLSQLAPMLRDAVMQALEAIGGLTAGVIELTLDLGEGITKRIRVALDQRDAQLTRRVAMGRR